MKRKDGRARGWRACFRAVSVLALVSGWGISAGGSAPAHSPKLTVENQDGVAMSQPVTARFNAGDIDRLRRSQCAHVFVLKNDETVPLTIDHLQPTCGCTTALLEHAGSEATLEPGKEISVRVTVDTSHLQPGEIRKSVYVFLRGTSTPAATLEMVANILPEVTFHPSLLAFGRLPFNGKRSLPLTATVAAGLLEPSIAATLTSSDPNITIAPTGIPVKSGGKTETVTLAYNVTLSGNGNLGMRRGNLLFAPKPSALVPSDASSAAHHSLTRSWASLSVTGDIAGNLSMNPPAAVFGRVRPGANTRQVVVVESTVSRALEGMIVSSPYSWLSVRLIPGDGATDKRVVEISLRKSAPAGEINTHITVSATDGENLILPVLAYIDPR